MDITPLVDKGKKIIKSYGDGGFNINGVRYEGGVFLTPHTVTSFDGQFTIANLENMLSVIEFEICLIGTGASQIRLSQEIREYLMQKNIVADVMSSPAACRTFNILQEEGRSVVAIII